MNSNTHDTQENLSNVEESENLPMDLPSEILDQPVEKRRTNQNGNLVEVTQNELKPGN